jgi:hypothetical protein
MQNIITRLWKTVRSYISSRTLYHTTYTESYKKWKVCRVRPPECFRLRYKETFWRIFSLKKTGPAGRKNGFWIFQYLPSMHQSIQKYHRRLPLINDFSMFRHLRVQFYKTNNDALYQWITKRCRLSWLTISALVYAGGGGKNKNKKKILYTRTVHSICYVGL